MATRSDSCDTLVIGAGLAGIACALELLDLGQSVLLLDAAGRADCGGQANNAFGGMLLCGTREQRRAHIEDSPELLFADWQRAAEFQPDDVWARRWAEAYAEYNRPEVYDWLKQRGIGFLPAVQWPERGNHGDGNSLPRYHVAWGCGRGIVQTLAKALFEHPRSRQLQTRFDHRVTALEQTDGAVSGCRGHGPEGDFEIKAGRVVVASGGINGNLDKVRQHWDPIYGDYPDNVLTGTDPRANGAMHDVVAGLGGQVVDLGQMWNYAAGIAAPEPQFPRHGVSLIPPRSALWLDAHGRRIGPAPMMTGLDTHDLCKQLGHLPGQYGWQLLNWRIGAKEIAISGSDSNPAIRDHKLPRLLWQMLRGNDTQMHDLVDHHPDVLAADSLEGLADKMRALADDGRLEPQAMRADIERYDAAMARGPTLHNDEQIAHLQNMRRYRGDRLRLCKMQAILDPKARPLIAIRTRLIIRKSMGGMRTDLAARVLGADGAPLPGLYAIGEAAGFGGGGISGIRSLEGTFLSNCVFNARRAARDIQGQGATST